MARCSSVQMIGGVNGRVLHGIQIRNHDGDARRVPLQVVVPAQDEFFFCEVGVAAGGRGVHKIVDVRIALRILPVADQHDIVPVVLCFRRVIGVVSPGLNHTDDGRVIVKGCPEL